MENSSTEILDLSSLPQEKWWSDECLYQVGGFWLMPEVVQSVDRVIKQFKPLPSDTILASFPKTGTTWLKSLLFSIVHRSSKDRLAIESPHNLVPSLEMLVYAKPNQPLITSTPFSTNNQSFRIFSTHIPYQLLAETLDSSECRVVYVTRNPKDALISMWHFVNKWEKTKEESWPFEVAVDKFCNGPFPYGPYYDHVMGYKKLSMERPSKFFFVTYEELKNDTKTHVMKLAEFLGCPFDGEDVEEQVEEVVKSCSFEVLSNHEVNKSEESLNWFKVPLNAFFRKGTIRDHENYLSDETIERIDELTREKFHSCGFMYGI